LVGVGSAEPPVKVSGLIVVPNGSAPAGGLPVVSWAHPTNGMVSACAPSLDPDTAVPLANALLSQGWEITATDYLNENAFTPNSNKLLPYTLGAEAARNAIDIVRAAHSMTTADASTSYQVWGWSEGGQTAMFASSIAATYAPELTLHGAVVFAPPSQFAGSTFFTHIAQNATYWPLLLMQAAGLNSAYGSRVAPLAGYLTTAGKKNVAKYIKSEPQCISSIVRGLASHSSFSANFAVSTPSAAWSTVLSQQDPEDFTTSGAAPDLIVQGSDDALVDPATSAALAEHVCELAPVQPLRRWLYSGLDHNTIIGEPTGTPAPNGSGDERDTDSSTVDDIVHWMADRFAGSAWPDPYSPTGAGVTAVTQTHSCS
jgi:hypothetical protein